MVGMVVVVMMMVVVRVSHLHDDLCVGRSVKGKEYKQGTKCEQTSLDANVHELPPETEFSASTSAARG
jgi:hypothetical protein